MKRLFTAFILMATFVTADSFAAGPSTGPDVLASFHNTFKYARNVSMVEIDGNLRISFTEEGQQFFAYYTPSGDLMGVAKPMNFNELPSRLQADLKKRYADRTIGSVYQLEMDNRSEYYVTLDSAKEEVILNSSAKKWKVFRRTKK